MRRAATTLILYLSLSVALAGPAFAAPSSVALEDLTWTELRDRIAAGTTTVLVPIGGTEQNGPHMALGKHNVRAKALAERIAATLGNALVAPVIAYVPEGGVDPPSGHMRFPGTLSIPDAAIRVGARIGGAQPQGRGLSRRRVSRRSRRVPEGARDRRGGAQSRMEGDPGARARDPRLLCRDSSTLRARH